MRFKADINDGEVTLTMKPGDTIKHGWHEPTDEGYGGGSVTFVADIEGVYRTYYTYGKDCDGKVESVSVDFCPWVELKAYDGRRKQLGYANVVEDGVTYHEMQYEPDPGWPNWQEYESSRHYDQYAQAMNY